MSKWKKIGLYVVVGYVIVAGTLTAFTDEEKEVIEEPIKKEIKVENLTNEAVTICRMYVESSLSSYLDIDFPFANRKVFKKEKQRYIVKDYVLFVDNGIKKKANWHCDLQFTGGNTTDTNNWKMLNFEMLK